MSSLQMASTPSRSRPHCVLLPFMAPGHLIPMVDMARILAQHGCSVTIVTTPSNAARFQTTIDRAHASGLPIQLLQVRFPGPEVGLPDGCENMDSLPSPEFITTFVTAFQMLQRPFEQLLQDLSDPPSCLISDKQIFWSAETASKFRLPWIMFDGTSCFTLLCTHHLHATKVYERFAETERFVVPGLPDPVEFTRLQLPGIFNPGRLDLRAVREQVRESEVQAYGIVVNSFEELELAYLEQCQKVRGNKIWCIGPVSQSNQEKSDNAQRGNKASVDETQCSEWLGRWPEGSVIYASLGSLSQLPAAQLIELGLGLEASNHPFIWVIRGNARMKEVKKWATDDKFEERVKGRGLLIWGWAPQLSILSHPAVGGFLTHCGWNSTLEGLCAGLPMATWPLFAEQFFNEKVVVEVTKVGVRVGAEAAVHYGEEESSGVLVGREDVRRAVEALMEDGEEGKERRRRARELQGMANRALEPGGSSFHNIDLLIEDIKKLKPPLPVKV